MATPPLASDAAKDSLVKKYVGKVIQDVPTPSAILDVSKVRRNCSRMLAAVDKLQFGWRAHIKTHKTTELTRLQVGDGPHPANIIVSTIVEAENIVPLLLELKEAGRAVNVLYSFPVPPSSVHRLAAVSKTLGPSGLALMIDHPAQLPTIYAIAKKSGNPPLCFVKIDMGGKRSGVLPQSPAASQLTSDLLAAEKAGTAIFYGLYSHAGQSYSGSNRAASVDFLRQEFEALFVAAEGVTSADPGKRLVLSVGATPTATAVRNLLIEDFGVTEAEDTAVAALRGTITAIKDEQHAIEVHAGVYPILDIQQLATHALSTEGPNPMLAWTDLALTVLAEVASLYPGRGFAGRPEALVTAGSLALGREPCKAYDGWGVVSPWNLDGAQPPDASIEHHEGWQVGRISQEHGILTWSGDEDRAAPLTIGQKIRIWPNHACITGANFDWYLVVDSDREGREDEIVDVWPRWRGW